MIERKESQAQIMTWELKDNAWAEVAHLPLEEAIRKRLQCSTDVIQMLGFEGRIRDPRAIGSPHRS